MYPTKQAKQHTRQQRLGLGTILSLIMAYTCAYSLPAYAFDKNEIDKLRSASKELATVRNRLVKVRNKRDATEDKLQREEDTLQLLQSRASQKKQAYRKILKIVSDNPDLDLTDKVANSKTQYTQQKKLVDKQQTSIKVIDRNLARYNNSYREKKSEIAPLETSYVGLKKAIVEKELKKRIRSFKVSKKVTAKGRYSCGELKLPVCKARARKNAEQVAVEQGSSVLINSMTEVRNFQLSKEIIRSEVGATLSNVKVTKKNWLGEDTWVVAISATVTPSLSNHLKSEMYANVENDLNTKLALNSPIGTMGGAYTPPRNSGLVKEDYPRNRTQDRDPASRLSREQIANEKAREKQRRARALANQKTAEAAAASAAALEAEAATSASDDSTAKALKAAEEASYRSDKKPKKRRVIGGF